jgi:hypothetical protein
MPINLAQAENAPSLVLHCELAAPARQMDFGAIVKRRLVETVLV